MIGGYGIGGSIIPLIISAVVALFLLTGMQWVRYLFIANSALNIVNTFISLIFIINDYSISVPLLVLNSIFFAFYVFSFVVLLVNKSVKAYFENE